MCGIDVSDCALTDVWALLCFLVWTVKNACQIPFADVQDNIFCVENNAHLIPVALPLFLEKCLLRITCNIWF